ncbi:stress-induced acidophilic repeat motif-containing protein, partial [Salmonella enterica]|nr:stress-induced acidophilic repeat motif-containing protein [Salmonella enterica]
MSTRLKPIFSVFSKQRDRRNNMAEH